MRPPNEVKGKHIVLYFNTSLFAGKVTEVNPNWVTLGSTTFSTSGIRAWEYVHDRYLKKLAKLTNDTKRNNLVNMIKTLEEDLLKYKKELNDMGTPEVEIPGDLYIRKEKD